jgi:hypothetical protein
MYTPVAIKGFLGLGENPKVQFLARFLKLMHCPIEKRWYSKGKVEGQHNPILTSALDRRECSASLPGRFIPGDEERHDTH